LADNNPASCREKNTPTPQVNGLNFLSGFKIITHFFSNEGGIGEHYQGHD